MVLGYTENPLRLTLYPQNAKSPHGLWGRGPGLELTAAHAAATLRRLHSGHKAASWQPYQARLCLRLSSIGYLTSHLQKERFNPGGHTGRDGEVRRFNGPSKSSLRCWHEM